MRGEGETTSLTTKNQESQKKDQTDQGADKQEVMAPGSEAERQRPGALLSTLISRRRLLTGLTATAGLWALGARGQISARVRNRLCLPLPVPDLSGLEHVIVVMMENRSFDHYLGWLPGADGRQEGLTYTDHSGASFSTYHLTDYQGCEHPDPDHSFEGGRVEFNSGACDGWLQAGNNDIYAIGYYTDRDLPFFGQAVPSWTTFDRYFAAFMGPTYPNRIYQHSGQTDRLHNSFKICTLPTIWDRLAEAGLSGRYYYSDLPFLALWGLKYLSISRPFDLFLSDCAEGALAHVSFIDPRFLGDADRTSGDDHPHADIRNGQEFLCQVYKAVVSSPAWPKTLLIINYDEWGGFYDHVPPEVAPDINSDYGLRGFRVPCLLVSPWSGRGLVSNTVYDHTSILKLIEWRWNLAPLAVRDAAANNIAEVLDFEQSDLNASDFDVPSGPFGAPCRPAALMREQEAGEWQAFKRVAQNYGWPI